MSSGLTVTMSEQTEYIENNTQGFRITITSAVDGSVAPLPDAKIFLYTRQVPIAETGATVDKFIAVCSPLDMEEYPANAPADDAVPPFFRLATVDLVHTNREFLYSVWEDIKSDINKLAETLTAMKQLQTGEVLEVSWPT